MRDAKIRLLKKQINKLDQDDFDLEAWKVSTQLLLTQLFGKFDPKTITIRDLKIDYSSTMLRDSNANYKPIDTCKKKGREILELSIDQLLLDQKLPSELQILLDQKDQEGIHKYLKGQKKEDLIGLLTALLSD